MHPVLLVQTGHLQARGLIHLCVATIVPRILLL